MRLFQLLFAACLICTLGCGDGEVLPPRDIGQDYFPIAIGSEWTYQVDSVIFDDGGSPNILDTLNGFVRERVIDKVIDLVGDSVYRLERSFRRTGDEPWRLTDIWTTSVSEFAASRNEGNVKLLKLEFPLSESTHWEPTRFVSKDLEVQVGTELIEMYTNWDGRVLTIGEPRAVGNLFFDDVLTCQQADDDNEIERRYVYEEYARGVGLIMRVDTILDSYCKRIGQIEPCLGQTWNQKGEKGYILHQQLIDFK